MALVDLERQALVLERERLDLLEKQLDLQKKAIEYALEVAARAVAILQPDADDQIKAMLIQILLPTLLHGQTIKGLELVLPPTPRNEKHQQEQPE